MTFKSPGPPPRAFLLPQCRRNGHAGVHPGAIVAGEAAEISHPARLEGSRGAQAESPEWQARRGGLEAEPEPLFRGLAILDEGEAVAVVLGLMRVVRAFAVADEADRSADPVAADEGELPALGPAEAEAQVDVGAVGPERGADGVVDPETSVIRLDEDEAARELPERISLAVDPGVGEGGLGVQSEALPPQGAVFGEGLGDPIEAGLVCGGAGVVSRGAHLVGHDGVVEEKLTVEPEPPHRHSAGLEHDRDAVYSLLEEIVPDDEGIEVAELHGAAAHEIVLGECDGGPGADPPG